MKGIIEILTRGQGDPEALILWTTFVICLYEGGDKSHCTVVVGRDGTQLGISKELNGLIELKVLAKILVHVVTSKEGNSNVPVTEICQWGTC